MKTTSAATVLLVEDDEADCLLLRKAFDEVGPPADVRVVSDGEELLDYLHGRGRFSEPDAAPRPDLILLDLNMPRKDGRDALQEIKSQRSELRWIPVVVITTSSDATDVVSSYQAGAASFVTKPNSFEEWIVIAKGLRRYWCELAETPA